MIGLRTKHEEGVISVGQGLTIDDAVNGRTSSQFNWTNQGRMDA
jgi:hypothetical protein